MSKKFTNPTIFAVSETTTSKLQTDWQNIVSAFCYDATINAEVFQLLVQKYSEKHRAYHNLSHINYLLEEARKIEFEDFDSIFFTTWFHDVIYEPRKSDNEPQSAELAETSLQKLGFPAHKTAKVRQMILATQKHSPENLDADGQTFLDLDLSILGANEEIYQNYSRAIRQEYSYVPFFLYRHARKRVLQSFLARDPIFFTENLRRNFEKQARFNLLEEIGSLSGKIK